MAQNEIKQRRQYQLSGIMLILLVLTVGMALIFKMIVS